MAGYVWRAKRDLRGGVVMPSPIEIRGISQEVMREWRRYMRLNARANEAYWMQQEAIMRRTRVRSAVSS